MNKMAKKKYTIQEVTGTPDFPAMEKDLLAKWYSEGIVEKYLHKNDKSKKKFSFQDGPITANNPMGVHHAWGRTYKDLWQRYHNMKGERGRFQNGFDCQGLWVEVEVEKRLGYFMDWDNSYYTMSDENNYMIWHFLKVCHQKGWIYKGKDSVPWCPRCETAISQHEMLTEDYKELTHETVFLKLPITTKGFENK